MKTYDHGQRSKLRMQSVTALLVTGVVAMTISQAPLFRSHSGYEADHCHPCLQMPANNDGVLYPYNRLLVKSAGFQCLGQDQRGDAFTER